MYRRESVAVAAYNFGDFARCSFPGEDDCSNDNYRHEVFLATQETSGTFLHISYNFGDYSLSPILNRGEDIFYTKTSSFHNID